MNNASFFSADRTIHLKIVALALLASIVVMAVGIAGHAGSPGLASGRVQIDGPPLKPGKALMVTRAETGVIR